VGNWVVQFILNFGYGFLTDHEIHSQRDNFNGNQICLLDGFFEKNCFRLNKLGLTGPHLENSLAYA